MIRELESLSTDEIRLIARDAADAGEPIPEWTDPSARHAVAFERAYRERQLQLEQQEG